MKNRKVLWVVVALLSLVIASCLIVNIAIFSPLGLKALYQGQATEINETGLISVGVCQVGSESVWRTANTNSIKKNLSEDNGFFMRFSNARQKQENQIKIIREFISQKVDYIVLSPATEYGWDTVLLEAKNAGIPVILMDRTIQVEDDSLYTCFVGTDMTNEGRMAAQWLEKYLEKKQGDEGALEDKKAEEQVEVESDETADELDEANQSDTTEKINIVVLKGTVGSTAEIGRSKGFMEIADEHPEWNIIEMVDADFTTTKAREVMRDIVSRYDDIDVVVSQNDDMTFGAVEVLDEAGITHGQDGDITIISFDAVKKALRMVRDGDINADVECNPNQGDMIASLIKNIDAGIPVEKTNYISDNVFTNENVNAYLSSRTY